MKDKIMYILHKILHIMNFLFEAFCACCAMVLFVNHFTKSIVLCTDLPPVITISFITCLSTYGIMKLIFRLLFPKSLLFPKKEETVVRVKEDAWCGTAKKVESDETITRQRKRDAIHEAGHALMAHLCQLPTYEVFMLPTNDSNYPHVYATYQSQDKPEDIETIILVRYAGAAAEELLTGHFGLGSILSQQSDFVTATEFIKAYLVITDPMEDKTLLSEKLQKATQELSRNYYEQAKSMVEKHQEELKVLAKELETKDYMSQEEIDRLLNEFHKTEGEESNV